jgi:hypothetical protein
VKEFGLLIDPDHEEFLERYAAVADGMIASANGTTSTPLIKEAWI